jgi:hypothetical protein
VRGKITYNANILDVRASRRFEAVLLPLWEPRLKTYMKIYGQAFLSLFAVLRMRTIDGIF